MFMTTYKQGDIILVWFPHSDLQTMKKRPAIVLKKGGRGQASLSKMLGQWDSDPVDQ